MITLNSIAEFLYVAIFFVMGTLAVGGWGVALLVKYRYYWHNLLVICSFSGMIAWLLASWILYDTAPFCSLALTNFFLIISFIASWLTMNPSNFRLPKVSALFKGFKNKPKNDPETILFENQGVDYFE